MYSIYRVTNTKNLKVYIGYTKNPEKRWSGHQKTALGKGRKQRFHNAIVKHGLESFTFEVIESGILTRKDANDRERFWIKEHDSYSRDKGYNGTPGGDGGPTFLGRHHTDEYRARMSEIQRNRSPEWRENFKRAQQNRSEEWHHNMRVAQQNRPPTTDEAKAHLRDAWQRRKARNWSLSDESRQRLSDSLKGKQCPQQTRDGVSDARKLVLLQQDVAIIEGTTKVSVAAMRRHRIRMKERFWETFQFKSQAVEELAKDLRLKVQHRDLCPEGLN